MSALMHLPVSSSVLNNSDQFVCETLQKHHPFVLATFAVISRLESKPFRWVVRADMKFLFCLKTTEILHFKTSLSVTSYRPTSKSKIGTFVALVEISEATLTCRQPRPMQALKSLGRSLSLLKENVSMFPLRSKAKVKSMQKHSTDSTAPISETNSKQKMMLLERLKNQLNQWKKFQKKRARNPEMRLKKRPMNLKKHPKNLKQRTMFQKSNSEKTSCSELWKSMALPTVMHSLLTP